MKTLVKKILELSERSQLKINLLIYDERFHKIEEIWSHEELKIENVNQLLKEIEADDLT